MSTTTAASGKDGWTDFAAAHLDDERRDGRLLAQEPEDGAGEVALERSERFEAAFAGRLFALQVGAGAGVATALDDRDLVQRGVELTGAVAGESVAALLARGRVDRGDTGELRELRVVLKSSSAAGFGDELAGDQCAAAREFEQLWGVAGDPERYLALKLVGVTSRSVV